MKDYKEVKTCRICDEKNLTSYLNLGNMPLANGLITKKEILDEKKYPLEVMFCKNCSFSQLNTVVNPEILFRNYVYRSSISNTFKYHCEMLSKELNSNILERGELIVDIASNDGCLLKPFKEEGNRVLGIDPAINLAEIANKSGIETLPKFWGKYLAKEILEKYGSAKIITAFNVFAHVDDIHSFVDGAKTLLSKEGYFIIESPHLYNLIKKIEFDTVYHEHLSYLLVKPLDKLMKEHNMRVAKTKKFEIHGGSIRLYIEHENKKDSSDGSTQKIINEEIGASLDNIDIYMSLDKKVKKLKEDLVSKLLEFKSNGKTISAFGASAKGNTLLNYCGIGNNIIDYIFDDTPEKQGKITPGVYIPIINGKELMKKKPDYLLLLAWNFVDEIMKKTKNYRESGGRYIIPVPNLKII